MTAEPTTTGAPPAGCERLDVVFVVDSSQSVGQKNFKKIMQFLVDMTKQFKVADDKFTQFAVVIFNNFATVSIELGEFDNIHSLDKEILKIGYTTGNTNTKDALEKVRDQVFQSTFYRPDVPHLVILITDGVHTSDPPFQVAKELRSDPYNAAIIAIGTYGTNGKPLTDHAELRNLTGDPSLVYDNITYNNLDDIIDWTIGHFPCEIKCPADVVFIVETAEIIGEDTVMENILYEMVPNMADLIRMGPMSSHASLVTFSSPDYMVHKTVSKVQFGFDEGKTYDSIRSKCKALTWNMVNGISDLYLGLELAIKAFNDSAYGARNGNFPKAAIVIATGFHDIASNCCPDPVDKIKQLQQITGDNTYAVMIDVQGKSNRTVLEMIAGAEERVYDNNDYRNVPYDIHKTQTKDCPLNCENGGTPIPPKCWCPPYFTGTTCGQWLCINGGKFDSSAKTCSCPVGYSGGHCEEVKCDKLTTMPDRGADKLTVIVYATNSMKNVITAAADGLKTVFDMMGDKNYIKQYILTGYTGTSNTTTTVNKADDFVNALKNLETQEVAACTENTNLFRGLDTSQRDVGHGKIVLVFLNSLPDDPNDAQFLAWQMENAHYQSQYFFILTPPKMGCTLDKASKGYKAIQNVAKLSGGLVIELAENEVKDFLTKIQTGQPSSFAPLAAPSQGVFFNAPNTATLLRANNDEQCEDSTHMFYVDSTMHTILISATGNALSMQLTKDGTVLELDTYNISNYFQYQYVTLATGTGRYQLTFGGHKTKPCAFRLSALTDMHLSYSFSAALITDSSSQSALYRTAMHLAATFTDVTPSLHWAHMAELKVFNFNDMTKPVHTSNGQYRAQCTYELYFGSWTCDSIFDMYFFTVTFEDKNGYLAQRFGTTYCSDIAPTDTPPTGCENGGVMSDGKCVCNDYWYGDHCTKIMCTNGGWALRGDALCQCLPGFTGTHCNNNICEMKNPDADFSFLDRSIAFVIQLTEDMDDAIKYLKDNVGALVANLNAQNKLWITEYSLIGINDKFDSPMLLKGSSTTFINDVKELKSESGTAGCQKELLGGVETALSVAKRNGYVFVLANSPSKDNVTEYEHIFNFLESTKAQAFFYLATPFNRNCDPQSDTHMSDVADFSLGKVFMADMKQIPDFLLKFIPSLYQSGLVIEDMRPDCETLQTFTFSLDSHSNSFTIAAGGNMPQLELMKPRDCPCAVTTTVSPGTTPVVPPNCQNVNIIFVADASQSVGKDHFELMKDFMVKITKEFTKIGSNGTEFAVITFTRKGNIEFYLDTYQSIDSLDQAIDGLIWKDGITNTADGLQKAIDVFQNHSRATASNVVVLISDGAHTEGFDSPVANAKILRGSQYKATIISVGIESTNDDENMMNFEELIDISGSRDLVINVTNWNELQNHIKDVADKLPCLTPKPPNGDRDIAFVIETSEMMEEEYFKKTQQSVIGLAKQFNIGKSNTRLVVPTVDPCHNHKIIVQDDQSLTIAQADADKSGAGTCQSSDACFAGVWQATVKTGSKSKCWIQVRAKGELQLFNGFTTSVASDYARDEPYKDTCIKNYGLGHMTGLVQPLGGLEYMNIYVMNNSVPSMVHSARFTPRAGCAYDHRSEDFTCPGASFGMAYVGHDHCGYQFSRVKTAICMKFECLNGGHKETSFDATCSCICPKNFFGSDCGLPVCYNNGKMSNKKCVCSAGFNGDHCETAQFDFSSSVMCTSQSQITYGGKGTLVLVVDTTTDMQSVLDEFKDTADDLMDTLKSDFSKFVLVPYHDGDSPLGTITSDADSSKIAAALKVLTVSADTDCPNPTMAALNAALDKAIPPAMTKTDMSMVFVITKSSAKDATMEDQVLANVASSGVTVNFVIPGASDCIKTSDDIPSLYQQVSIASGGFVFPIGLGNPVGANPLYNFLVSYIPESLGSQLVASESSSECQDFIVYMPVDRYTNANLTITLSGTNAIAADVRIITPDGTHHTKPELTFSSSDLNVMSVTIDPSTPPFDYGLYRFSITMNTSTSCKIQAKVKMDDRTFLGFITTDVHSDTAVDVPVYPGSANRLIAHVSGTHMGANFKFAKFYSTSMELLAVEDLEMRGGCSYGLLSTSFECHAKIFWVQISGHDDQGYILERWTAAQCPSYPSSPTSTIKQ